MHVGDIDAEIINQQAERDVSPDMVPETTRSMLALVIPFDGKAFFE